jgi:hypothetical protein
MEDYGQEQKQAQTFAHEAAPKAKCTQETPKSKTETNGGCDCLRNES